MRVYAEGYIFNVHDADTPYILVPCDEELGLWKIIHVRIKDLHAPEQSTPEGKALTERVREVLLQKWTKVSVQTSGKSFERRVGSVKLASGEDYADLCRRLMAEMGIEEGGR